MHKKNVSEFEVRFGGYGTRFTKIDYDNVIKKLVQVGFNTTETLETCLNTYYNKDEQSKEKASKAVAFAKTHFTKASIMKYMEEILNKNNVVKNGGNKKIIRKSLDKCTVEELKARSKKRGIKVTGLKKAEIIAKLRNK